MKSILLLLAITTMVGCARRAEVSSRPSSMFAVQEVFRSDAWPEGNIDSLALWSGGGRHLLFATGKESDMLYVLDGETGALVRTVGGSGTKAGELDRPNGVVVAGDLLFVVERNNHRVQVFALPGVEPVAVFGENELVKPYGIDAWRESGAWRLVVTDDFDAASPGDYARRVKAFRFAGTTATYLGAFGETEGPGRLDVVETIVADAPNDRLLICDEANKSIDVYTLDGAYTGRSFGGDFIVGDPEGLGIFRPSGSDDEGWLTITDQRPDITVFHVMSRDGARYIGSFTGDPVVANTDGICLANGGFGPFRGAALYAVHDDASVAAFSFGDVVDAIRAK